MAINPYFKGFNFNSNEQDLVSRLNRECIKIHGQDMYYIPRTLVNEDKLFGEDTLAAFEKYYTIEMYVSSFEGFGEGTDLLAKFGLAIKDEASFEIERVRFTEETGMLIPLEGDLIYYPIPNALFEIKFVEDESQFYPLGRTPLWTIKAVLFTYSSEEFETGADEIDNIMDLDTGSDGDDMFGEDYQTEADTLLDKSESDPFDGW